MCEVCECVWMYMKLVILLYILSFFLNVNDKCVVLLFIVLRQNTVPKQAC